MRFEMSAMRLGLYSVCLAAALAWMFVLGVLVGRGIPMVDLNSQSLYSQLLRFLGLGRPPVQAVENAAETWDPQAVLKSLEYYENLTQKDSPADKPAAGIAPGKAAPRDATAQKPRSSSPESSAGAESPRPEGDREARLAREAPPAMKGEEHFTLLVVSLRDAANATRVVDQLKAKGYSPRLQSIDLNTGGRWNRVLVGSFGSREEASRFAAEFNRKEHMEGLVIRETQ
ncbi:MAG: SPOR domain-containing protein [Syntrophobacteraceae bacterium]|nr:SPOR domain-containing protein [Syntrophobacteraceae bacterium]